MPAKLVQVPDLGTIALYKRRGSRSIRLTVTPRGVIRISLPYFVPYQSGIRFARSRKTWIEAQLQQATITLRHGQPIGKEHILELIPSSQAVKVTTRLGTDRATVHYPQTYQYHDEAVQQAASKVSIRALRQQAEAALPPRLARLAAEGGYQYRSVNIKQLKSRWGSCNHQQDIVLNLFLMQLPWHLIDYVLWHELAHTRHLDHGPHFWDELSTHIPQAKRLRREIRQHRTALI